MATVKKRLGEILVDAGSITEDQLNAALEYKSDHGVYLGKAIIELGFLTEKQLLKSLGGQLDMPFVDLSNYKIQEEVLRYVDEKLAREHIVMPLFAIDNILTVASADPMDISVIDELSQNYEGGEINLVLATEKEIEQAIDLYYSASRYLAEAESGDGDQASRVVSKEIADDTETVEAVDMLLNEAVRIGASDIHVEPRVDDVRIRFRLDGVLQQYYTVPKENMAALISRVKVLSDMDIAESRVPQDGRFSYRTKDSEIDLRASSFPTPNGEKIVLRLLDPTKGKIDLDKLGFLSKMLKQWKKLIKTPNGIILVTGPTGSGKTTTLYATLNIVNSVEVNIMTVEDPIEYQLDNINQSQVNAKAGMTFSIALQAMLRQDPDIILVGEMRDIETIDLAIRAALTGHLVFSTLHTNDSASSFTRLLDMGVDTFLVSSSIRGILSQRLVRLLCDRCKTPLEPDEATLKTLEIESPETVKNKLFQPVGCVHCKNSGYQGRVGIYELLVPDDEIVALVNKHATSTEIEEVAVRKGMVTMHESAQVLVKEGRTSISEMIRVTI
ncbi:MAG: GspE/PulE family protein [Fidelibacterota bacterium]